MGTTAWRYVKGLWTDATPEWRSSDDWGWREELKQNRYDPDPAVRLGDIDVDSFAVEAYAAAETKAAGGGLADGDDVSGGAGGKRVGWAVIVSVGAGGDVVLVDNLPDLVALLTTIGPVVEQVQGLNLGATNAQEREYSRLRRLGYPHEVADEASRIFVEEIGDDTADEEE
jgi:hypothetical protein